MLPYKMLRLLNKTTDMQSDENLKKTIDFCNTLGVFRGYGGGAKPRKSLKEKLINDLLSFHVKFTK